MDCRLRPARIGDMPAIDAIYAHYIRHSTATFHLDLPSPAEREQWWREHDGQFPVLVAEDPAGRVRGWASLSPYIRRAAYRFTVENSIYIEPDFCGRGLGRVLLTALLEAGAAARFRTVIAQVCAEQPRSVALHERLGFRVVGRLERVGFKFDRWLDTIILQRDL